MEKELRVFLTGLTRLTGWGQILDRRDMKDVRGGLLFVH
jgi:hypothetical protein